MKVKDEECKLYFHTYKCKLSNCDGCEYRYEDKKMTYKDLYRLFTPSIKENFPKKECTVQNEYEPKIYDSNKKYLCLIVDTRFKHDYRVTLMTPYICKTDSKTEYGWVDCLFKQPHTNLENTARIENEVVVGFTEFAESDEADKMWDSWIESVENQWD